MGKNGWDVDEEATAWKNNRKKYQTKKNSTHVKVQLELRRNKSVTLTVSEFKKLTAFVEEYTLGEIKPSSILHLPSKVQIIILDWCGFKQ